jgi:hypothetical protein
MMYALDEVTGACHSVSCTLRRSWPMIWMACHTKTLSFFGETPRGRTPHRLAAHNQVKSLPRAGSQAPLISSMMTHES